MTKTGPAADRTPAGGGIRWARAVGASLLALLLLAAAAVTWLVNDTERARRTVEGVVSAIGDRPFTIEGEFDYDLGRIITIRAGKIRWRSPASNSAPYLLEIEQFAGSFDLLSLFYRPILVTEVQVTNATLRFEWDDHEGLNWRLGTVANTKPKRPEPPEPLPLVIDQASVQNVSIRLRHPALTEELEIVVNEARHSGNARGKNDDVDARLQLGTATARVTGSLSEAADLSGSQLQFTVDAPDAHQLAQVAGIAAPAGARLRLQGSGAITAKRISFENLKASVADSELTGTAWLDRRPKHPGLNFDGQVKGPNLASILAPLLPASARSTLPQLRFAASAKLRLGAESLVIRTASASVGKSQLEFIGRADLAKRGMNLSEELSVRGDSLAELLSGLGSDDLPDKAFSLKSRLRMSPDAIRFNPLSFNEEQVSIDGKLAFTGKDYSRIEFELTASGESLTDLVPGNDTYRPADVPFSVAASGATDLAVIAVDHSKHDWVMRALSCPVSCG